MRARSLAACLLVVSLAACEEAFGPGSTAPEASSFVFGHAAFGGRAAGTFSAVGEAPLQPGGVLPLGDWAFAHVIETSLKPVVVEASRGTGGGRFDVVSVVVPGGAQAGQTLAIGSPCGEPDGCASMIVDFGLVPETLERQFDCALRSGTLQLTTFTGDRVAGTFSGRMVCEELPGVEARVQGGQFDVAILEIPPH